MTSVSLCQPCPGFQMHHLSAPISSKHLAHYDELLSNNFTVNLIILVKDGTLIRIVEGCRILENHCNHALDVPASQLFTQKV
jgi:hypothetical protein